MKKHNEGYTLPLVLVVMIVMCLIAVSVMSVALHNLQAQKAPITRMQDKYEAQGEVETVIAIIEKGLSNPLILHHTQLANAKEDVEKVISDVNEQSDADCSFVEWIDGTHGSCTVKILCMSDMTKIECVIRLNSVIDAEYSIQIPEITYDAYAISVISEEVPDDA